MSKSKSLLKIGFFGQKFDFWNSVPVRKKIRFDQNKKKYFAKTSVVQPTFSFNFKST